MRTASRTNVAVGESQSALLVSALQALARAKDLEDVTATVRSAARRLVNADGVSFVLRDSGHCHYVDEDAIGPLWKGQRFPLETCMTGWVMLNRESVIVPDITKDARVPQEAYAATFVKSMAAVPIRSEDPLGAIAAYWGSYHRATADEVQMLGTLADAASVAMENVRLLSSLQSAKELAERRAAENQMLFERAAHELVERERAERDRRLGQEDMSLVLAAGEMGTWEWNLETGAMVRSESMKNLTGRDPTTRGPDFTPVHPDDLPRLTRAIDIAREGGESFDEDFRFMHPRRGERWMRASGRFFYSALGKPVRMYGVLRDITQQRQVESRLRESERKLRIIFEHVPLGITLTDAGGTLIDVNPVASAILESAAPGESVLPQGLATGVDPWRPEEKSFQRKDGKTEWMRVRTSPVRDATGNVQYVVGMLENITQQRVLTEGLFQAQKMESIGRLAGGVAHDFNNALTVVMGWLGAMRPHAPASGPVQQGIEAIDQAAHHAAALTRQLLAFARRQILEARVVDLRDVVASTRRLMEGLVGEDVQVSVTADLNPLPVKVDAGQIEQVLLNLAANARDAMPKGGVIAVSTTGVELAEGHGINGLAPGRYAEIRFTDSGEGIAESAMPFIFEPFFTTKEPGKGTGLGLATAQGIIEQHGGHLDVTSEPGVGTTFTMTLPIAESQAPRTQAGEAPAIVPSGRETILLVEDEPMVRAVAAMMLRVGGYTVIEVEGPREALETVSSHAGPLDLLLSDVVMPGMNGVELAQRIAEIRPQMAVLLSSGYSEEAIGQQPATGPQLMFLAKPYTPESLLRRVRETLDRRTQGASAGKPGSTMPPTV